jgi:hypothetical protein
VFNLDTCGSASDLTSIEGLRLAAESHGDRSIEAATVTWTLEPQDWCQLVREQGGFRGGRLGVLVGA